MESNKYDYEWVLEHLPGYIKSHYKGLYKYNKKYCDMINEKIGEWNSVDVKEFVREAYPSNNKNAVFCLNPLTYKEVYELLYKRLCQKLRIKR